MSRLILTLLGDDRPPAELPRAGVLVVGSDSTRAGFHVEGQGVADAHCAIGRAKGGGWALKDLGSEYGTRVNGKEITQVRLDAGDEILIGSRRIRVEDPDASTATPSTAAATATAPPSPRRSSGQADGGSRAHSENTPAPELSSTAVRIPGFRLERLLGRGGMGQVYLAVQESLDRRVALKVLAPKLAADAEFVDQFQREARAAAALNHPNVVTVHDVGQAGGLHYIAMEYMEGGSLESRLAGRGPLPWSEVISILVDAAEGLVYAESRGIVHRDIKPDNLMLNEVGATKIADLGLASYALEDQGDKKIVGTPHFMAPEQVRGEELDARTDIYGLGATAYRLLSGHTIFEGESTRDILRSVLRDDPPPLAGDIPEGVRELVQRTIAKDPAERFPSAKILLRELQRLQQSDGATGSDGAVAGAGAGGSKRLLVGVGAALVVGVAGLVLFTGGKDDPSTTNGGAGTGTGSGSRVDAGTGAEGFDPEPEFGNSDPNDASGTQGPTAAELEVQLEERERNAENAYLRLKLRDDLGDEERRDLLRELAAQFPGTTTAETALEDAGQLDAQLLAAEREAAERALRVGTVIDALREASQPNRTPPRPAEALAAMERVSGQAELLAEESFLTARRELVQGVIDRGLEYAEGSFGKIAELESAGDFTGVRGRLENLVAALDLPEASPLIDGVNRVERLRERHREAKRRLDRIAESEDEFRLRRAEAERTLLVNGLQSGAGLESELVALDLAAARTRLEALEAEIQTAGDANAFVSELLEDVRLGSAALEMIHREWSSWRRKTIIDPRSSRKSQASAVAVDAEGVKVEQDGGVAAIPWSAFGDRPRALHQLFQGRLLREYTDEEERGISALLRFASVLQAIQQAGEMFETRADSRFTPGEAEDLREVFDDAVEWAEGSPCQARCQREAEADALLAEVLLQTTEGAFTSAAAGIERLLGEFGDTLLVRLLSDGSEWELPPVPEAPPEPESNPDGPGSGSPDQGN